MPLVLISKLPAKISTFCQAIHTWASVVHVELVCTVTPGVTDWGPLDVPDVIWCRSDPPFLVSLNKPHMLGASEVDS